MFFYPHHIGDFNNATRHLNRLERSIYRDLLDIYYDTESPLPPELSWIYKRVLANSDDEKEAVNLILSEFFTLENQGYRNKRCDEVLSDYYQAQDEKDEKRKNERERKRKYRDARKELFRKAADMGISLDWNATNEQISSLLAGCPTGQDAVVTRAGTAIKEPLTINHKPLTIIKEQDASASYVSFNDFWKLYPRKEGRLKAEQSWNKLRITSDLFENKIKPHLATAFLGVEPKFIPHGSTYVNQQRWQDEPSKKITINNGDTSWASKLTTPNL